MTYQNQHFKCNSWASKRVHKALVNRFYKKALLSFPLTPQMISYPGISSSAGGLSHFLGPRLFQSSLCLPRVSIVSIMSMEPFYSPEGHLATPTRRRFGLIPNPNSPPRPATPTSPAKISMDDYEKEGREETRKELAALFQRLEANPKLTEHLPHVTRAMKENGKSSAQTERLKALRKGRKDSGNGCYIALGILLVTLALLGSWVTYSRLTGFPALPQAALGSSDHLLSALQHCTEHSDLHGLPELYWKMEVAQNLEFNPACVNLIDSATRASPLHLASSIGSLDNLQLLLRHGAKIEAVDRLGSTPLHAAHDAATVNTLLQAGANPRASNQHGRTPLFTCYDESAASALIKADSSLLEMKDTTTGATALQETLRRALHASSRSFTSAINKASTLISLMPHNSVPTMATSLDFPQETALQLVLELASSPNPSRRLPGISLLTKALMRLSEYVVIAETSVIPEDVENAKMVSVAVSRLCIASELVKADDMGTISSLLAASLTTNNQDATYVLLGRFVNFLSLDVLGRFPLSYVTSENLLRMLIDHGVPLYPEEDKSEHRGGIIVHQILQALSVKQADMKKQLDLVKFLSKYDEPRFSAMLKSVPAEVKTTIERRFALLNTESLAWNVETLILGLELLGQPSHQQYQRIPVGSREYNEMPLLLAARTSAQFDVSVVNVPIGSPYVIDLQAYSEVDNVNMQCMTAGALQTINSFNSWFGAMPRIRLPVDLRSANASEPSYKIILQCGNFFSPCVIDLKIQTFEADEQRLDQRTPLYHSYFNARVHLYSIARLASIVWLPIAMLPPKVPIVLRFLPFFISLAGVYPAGPVYIVYWLAYTTLSHICMRLFGL